MRFIRKQNSCFSYYIDTLASRIVITSPEMFKTLLQIWPQWVATLIAILLPISIGLAIGWTSPYLALLTNEESLFLITSEEASWIASLLPLGRLLGAVVGSLCVAYLDSKTSLLLTGVPLIGGWICIIFADSAVLLYTFRILSGMSMGMLFSCYPLYIGEISMPSIRGALVGLVINGLPLGTLLGNIMGPKMSMMYFGIISLVVTICYLGTFPFLPQSPHYFVRRGDMERARKAIQWYNRKTDTRSELENVELYVKSSSSVTLSGLNSIVFYMEIIVREAMVTSIAPSTVVIIISAAAIICGWIGAFAIDRYGRRILLAISTISVTIGILLLALHFWLLDYDYDPRNLEWLVILAFLVFTLLFMGVVPVPTTMLSELFQSDLKSLAGFVASVTSAIFAFIAAKTYQPLVDIMSEQYLFCAYAVLMVGCLIYSMVKVPETKGKTLQEIQDMMAIGNSGKTQKRNDDKA
ncbi:PREDICTED: facilitated trehalose transporter Tret1-like isoform X3 [Dinoponera quadriceps]|uniref:Facilitated trehalose transporter Tret1-like isoform X3 n=1 Tax=Dinoponera quadriceps TaxID=609295 RepID=A0A6P3WV14_DINQU|nr:PREDICTED: facilitated trehalose transporter Tret1-like isoform X3 [Dinoponera quadriceps]